MNPQSYDRLYFLGEQKNFSSQPYDVTYSMNGTPSSTKQRSSVTEELMFLSEEIVWDRSHISVPTVDGVDPKYRCLQSDMEHSDLSPHFIKSRFPNLDQAGFKQARLCIPGERER
ncbi:hypothetical protein RRG08_023333 [Elysia crispata]|uniref:Uncharacterized protein n=1 Tax=Elysia crispata TaxID=231223 RepID=A0AAE1BE45_9GAST|nr:hypothetical protein RRG08_023333 [Elysia crispata]